MTKYESGRQEFRRSRLNQAVRLACVSMAVGPLVSIPAFADVCGAGTTTISTAVAGDNCELDAGESVSVAAGGSITGTSPTVVVRGVTAGNIENSGTLGDGSNTYGIYLENGSRLTGGITNNAGGLIDADTYGIYIYGSTVDGSITNNGTLLADETYSLWIENSTIGGDVVNNGLIDTTDGGADDEDGYGIYVIESMIGGSIINSGTIRNGDYYGIYLYGSSVGGDLVNSGLINMQDDTDYGDVRVIDSNIDGDFRNSGTILANGEYSVYIENSTIGGDFVNSGLIDNADEEYGVHIVDSTIAGSLINSGTIAVSETYSLYVYGTSIGGNLVNSGLIHTTRDDDEAGYGIYVLDSDIGGNLENSGTIRNGDYYGIYLYGSTVGGNFVNSGLIDMQEDTSYGDVRIVESEITGNVQNSGTILANGDYGLYIGDSTIGGNVENSGLIDSGEADGVLIDDDTTVAGNVVNSGTVTAAEEAFNVEDGTTINGRLENTGLIRGSEGLTLDSSTVTGGVFNSGTIVGTSGDALQLDSMNALTTVTNTGLIDGTVSLDDNIFVLGGTSARVTGDVTGAAGSLVRVTGDFTSTAGFMVDNFTVTSNGILRVGSNIMPASGLTNSGVVAGQPGAAGVITGNLTNTATGSVGVIIDSATSFSQLNVTGTADLTANRNVHVLLNTLVTPGLEFDDVLTAGTLTNGAALTSTDNSVLFDFMAVKDGNTIDVTAERGVLLADAVNVSHPYAVGAGQVLDTLLNAGVQGTPFQNFFTQLAALQTEAEVADAVAQVVPGLAGQSEMAARQVADLFSGVVGNRITGQRGLAAGDSSLYQDGHLWIKPFGGYGDQDRRSGVPGFDADTVGIGFGGDLQLNDRLLLGAGFAWSDTEIEGKTINRNELNVDTYQFVTYGSYALNASDFVEGYAIVGWNENSSLRDVNVGNIDGTAEADYDSLFTRVYAGAGREYQTSDRFTFTPMMTLRYTYIDEDGYTESGLGPLNLTVGDRDGDSLVLGVDGVGTYKLDSDGTYALTVRGGAGYDVLTDRTLVTSTFAGGGGAFATRGQEPDEFVYRGGFGLKAEPQDMMSVRIDYEFEGRSGWQSHGGSMNLRWRF